MTQAFYKVEFDPSFFGGGYTSQGNDVLIPESLVDELGMDKAFEKTTGHVAANIVHYSEDDRFDALGEFLDELPDAPVAEIASEPVIELLPEPTVYLPVEPILELPVEPTIELPDVQEVEILDEPQVEVVD